MIAVTIAFIISFSYFVQSMFGFGAGLLAIPLLSLFIDPKDAVIIVMIFSSVCGLLVIRLWKDVDWPGIRRLMPGLVLGVGAGLLLFSAIDRRYLGLVVAVYILCYVASEILRTVAGVRLGLPVPLRLQAFVAGFAGGVVQGVMGTGGPMLASYFSAHARSVAQFRASVTGIFFIANVMRLVVMGSQDFIAPQIVRHSLIAAPFFFLSMLAGNRLAGKVGQKTFHLIINMLLLLSAISVLVTQLT